MAAEGTSPRVRAGRGEVERQVLAAVEALLAEGEKFTALGVQGICAKAGVSRSAFYVNFADKTDLLLRLVESVTTSIFDVAGRWVEEDPHDLDGLIASTGEMVVQYRKHAPLLQAFAEVAAYDEQVAAFWRGRVEAHVELVHDRLERDQAAGLVPRDLRCRAAAQWLTWGAERTIAQHVAADPTGAGDEDVVLGIAQGTWALMRPR